jgi:uncharacterized glyoxalase superfamily protein PhnB
VCERGHPGDARHDRFHVGDVDRQHRRALAASLSPAFAPRDAPWGERYFRILDPNGHELSFASPLG